MIGSHLRLTHVKTNEDIERLAAFNAMIHGDMVADMTRHMLLDHPTIKQEHDKWIFFEDLPSGKIAAALCLITWQMNYEGVILKAGEVGIVGTDEAYRQQGLNRQLMAKHRELLAGYDLSHIQGIPYFYRQFGYEYAIPLEGGLRLYLESIPHIETSYTTRLATVDDIPALVGWYETMNTSLSISAYRDAAIWNYLLGAGMQTETAADTWIVLDAQQQAIGYFRVAHHNDFGVGLVLNEVSSLPHEALLMVIQQAKAIAIERGNPYIRVNIVPNHALNTVIQQAEYDATDQGRYAWQIHLPDPVALFKKLAPVFANRLATSPFARLSQQVVIDTYRQAYVLNFEQGTLQSVDHITDGVASSTLSLPPNLLAPLMLGHHDRAKLSEFYPDVMWAGGSQALIDVLFPKVDSFLYTQY